MPATPFLVIGRHNRRILHAAATLAEARGFSEGCSRPTAVAFMPELRGCTEWLYVFQVVNSDTGAIIAESPAMDFDDAAETLCSVKVMLVPACLARSVKP